MDKRFLDRKQAAAYLCGRGLAVSKNTLDKMATVGGGPMYQKFGIRCVYTTENLDAWVDQKLTPLMKSTSAPV